MSARADHPGTCPGDDAEQIHASIQYSPIIMEETGNVLPIGPRGRIPNFNEIHRYECFGASLQTEVFTEQNGLVAAYNDDTSNLNGNDSRSLVDGTESVRTFASSTTNRDHKRQLVKLSWEECNKVQRLTGDYCVFGCACHGGRPLQRPRRNNDIIQHRSLDHILTPEDLYHWIGLFLAGFTRWGPRYIHSHRNVLRVCLMRHQAMDGTYLTPTNQPAARSLGYLRNTVCYIFLKLEVLEALEQTLIEANLSSLESPARKLQEIDDAISRSSFQVVDGNDWTRNQPHDFEPLDESRLRGFEIRAVSPLTIVLKFGQKLAARPVYVVPKENLAQAQITKRIYILFQDQAAAYIAQSTSRSELYNGVLREDESLVRRAEQMEKDAASSLQP